MGYWVEEDDDGTCFYDEKEMLQHAIGTYGTAYDLEDWVRNTYDLNDLIEKAVRYDNADDMWNDLTKDYEESLLQEAGPAVKGQDYCIYDVNFIWIDDEEEE